MSRILTEEDIAQDQINGGDTVRLKEISLTQLPPDLVENIERAGGKGICLGISNGLAVIAITIETKVHVAHLEKC